MDDPRHGSDTMVCPSCAEDVAIGHDHVAPGHGRSMDKTHQLPVDWFCPHCECGCVIGYGGNLIAIHGGTGPPDQRATPDPRLGIRPASTVILLAESDNADLETLLVRRNASMKFHGGSWVFPGGGVDDVDVISAIRQVPESRGSSIALADLAARLAAVREVAEETGLTVEQEKLQLIGHWTTPVGRPRRFSTWFFLSRCDKDAIRLDHSELSDSRWVSPTDALEGFARGDLELPPPTFVTLTTLARASGVDDAFHRARTDGLLYVVPRYVDAPNGKVALFPGDVSYELVGDVETDLLDHDGPHHRLVLGQDGWSYTGPPH